MAGVKGAGGPVPKRSSQRRRTNKDSVPEKAEAAARVAIPEPDGDWHDAASAWYRSLADSGQSQFYEPSDWAVAWLIAESISRDLQPQVVGIAERTGEAVWATIPMKGASLAAYLRAMTALLVTEGDRRRARLELERPGAGEVQTPDVASLADYRSRLSG